MKCITIIFFNSFVCMALTCMFGQTQPAEDEVDYKIVVSRQTYDAGTIVRVTLIVINKGALPIHVVRPLAWCSNYSIGYAELKLMDNRGHDVTKEKRCAAEIGVPDAVAAVTNPKSWIELRPGEVYGSEADLKLPNQKGQYRIISELFPPGFDDEQKEALAKQHIRVLRNHHQADTVVITVR